jgi:hypothetical protein
LGSCGQAKWDGAMTGRSQTGVAGEFGPRWRRWTETVRLFAVRAPARFAVDQDEYRKLYGELTRLCREGVGSCDATEQALFRQLEEILRPWVTLDSLDWADREIVCKLRDQCQQVQQVLEGRPAARGNRRSPGLIWLGAGLLIAACLVLLVFWGGDPRSWSWVLSIGR